MTNKGVRLQLIDNTTTNWDKYAYKLLPESLTLENNRGLYIKTRVKIESFSPYSGVNNAGFVSVLLFTKSSPIDMVDSLGIGFFVNKYAPSPQMRCYTCLFGNGVSTSWSTSYVTGAGSWYILEGWLFPNTRPSRIKCPIDSNTRSQTLSTVLPDQTYNYLTIAGKNYYLSGVNLNFWTNWEYAKYEVDII